MNRIGEDWLALFVHLSAGLGSFMLAVAMKVPIVIWALLGLMVIDVLSGLIAAWITREISSTASWHGMLRKALVILLVLATDIAAQALPTEAVIPAGSLVAGAFCLHELVSIVENALRAGVEPPYVLRDLRSRFAQASEEREDQQMKPY